MKQNRFQIPLIVILSSLKLSFLISGVITFLMVLSHLFVPRGPLSFYFLVAQYFGCGLFITTFNVIATRSAMKSADANEYYFEETMTFNAIGIERLASIERFTDFMDARVHMEGDTKTYEITTSKEMIIRKSKWSRYKFNFNVIVNISPGSNLLQVKISHNTTFNPLAMWIVPSIFHSILEGESPPEVTKHFFKSGPFELNSLRSGFG